MSETVLLACKLLTFTMYADAVLYLLHGRAYTAIVPWALGTGILYHIRPYFLGRERARS